MLRVSWTPKVCNIMALRAILRGLGLLFYIPLGFRLRFLSQGVLGLGLQSGIWGFWGLGLRFPVRLFGECFPCRSPFGVRSL